MIEEPKIQLICFSSYQNIKFLRYYWVYLKRSRYAFDADVLVFNPLTQLLNCVNDGGAGTDPDDVAILDVIINSLFQKMKTFLLFKKNKNCFIVGS